MKRYYSMMQAEKTADIYIFGDIVLPGWKAVDEAFGINAPDVSGMSLVNDIKDLDVDTINVHINSYGGVVSEGFAIYNTLKSHPAKIMTYCDGFACSAASVVFMAGDKRVMGSTSMLMIHNAWQVASGNADDLRKAAGELEVISDTSANAYRAVMTISDDELKKMLADETWISPTQAVEYGFATEIAEEVKTDRPTQSARNKVYQSIIKPEAAAVNVEFAELVAETFDPEKFVDEITAKVMTSISQPKPEQEKAPIFNFRKDENK